MDLGIHLKKLKNSKLIAAAAAAIAPSRIRDVEYKCKVNSKLKMVLGKD